MQYLSCGQNICYVKEPCSNGSNLQLQKEALKNAGLKENRTPVPAKPVQCSFLYHHVE